MTPLRHIYFRLFIWGALLILLNLILRTISIPIYDYEVVLSYTKNWEGELCAEIAIAALLVIILTRKKSIPQEYTLVILEKVFFVGMLVFFFNMLTLPMQWLFSPLIILGMLTAVFVAKYLAKENTISTETIKLFGENAYPKPKALYSRIALTILALRLCYSLLLEFFNSVFPFNHNYNNIFPPPPEDTSSVYWLTECITIALAGVSIFFNYRMQPAENSKGSWLALLVSASCLCIFLSGFPVYLYSFFTGGSQNFIVILYFLPLILSVGIYKILPFESKKINEPVIIQLALVIFAVAYVLDAFFWVLYYSNTIYIYLQGLKMLLLIIFSKRISNYLCA